MLASRPKKNWIMPRCPFWPLLFPRPIPLVAPNTTYDIGLSILHWWPQTYMLLRLLKPSTRGIPGSLCFSGLLGPEDWQLLQSPKLRRSLPNPDTWEAWRVHLPKYLEARWT